MAIQDEKSLSFSAQKFEYLYKTTTFAPLKEK
jgi:hypothetical protein